MAVRGKPQRIWRYWLMTATIALMGFGMVTIAFPVLTKQAFSFLIFGNASVTDRFGTEASRYLSFVYGVLGATIVGWGLTILLVIKGPFSEGKRIGWLIIAVPLLVWFVLDSGYSLFSGYASNIVLNAGLLVLFAVPLVATFGYFFKDTSP